MYSSTPNESLRTLLDAHFSDQPPGEQVLLENRIDYHEELVNAGNRIFNSEAIKGAFSSFLPYKFPRRDGLYTKR